MAKFGKGSKHTLETRQKMSAARTGMKRSEESKRKISEGNQRTKALARGPLPERSRCGSCSEREGRMVLKPLKDFYLRRRTLASGETVFYPYPHCKACERARVRAHRDSLGENEAKRRQREYHRRHRARKRAARQSLAEDHRLPKGPFLEWFIGYRNFREVDFFKQVEMSGNSNGRRAAKATAGVFDSALFASHCGLTKTEYQSLARIAREGAKVATVSLAQVEKVLISVGQEHILYDLYPELASALDT